jgi:hypothetical protein
MASPNELGFNLRERLPLPHNILIRIGLAIHPDVRQPAGTLYHRGCEHCMHIPKDRGRKSDYRLPAGDTAKSGIGCIGNQCLNYHSECIHMNVGELAWDVKVNRPPMPISEVGGVIVLGARESRVHGEGHQGISVFLVESSSESDEFRTSRKVRL